MDVVRKLVSGRLQTQNAGPHPDPEVLAAFAEGSAPGSERNKILAHLATCTDCRDVYYLALPEPSQAQQVLAAPTKRPRFAMRWATLAASVVIVGGILLTNRGLFIGHTRPNPEVRVSTPVSPPAPTPPSENLQTQRDLAPRTLAKARPPLKHMTAKPQADMRFDTSDEVHFAARSSNQVQQAPAAQAMQAGALAPESKQAEPSRTSAVKRSIWRLAVDGRSQRSVDHGQTWQDASIDDGLALAAIVSNGDEIWAGGKAGVLYHSIDAGNSWTKIQPVSADKKLDSDITQIRFTDPANLVVSTASGKVWSTSNDGQTWLVK